MYSIVKERHDFTGAFVAILCLFIGLISANTLVIPTRFFMLVFAALSILLLSMLFPDKKIFFLFLLVFVLPINISKTLYQVKDAVFVSGTTLNVYAVDVVLAVLYLIWIYRRAVSPEKEKVILFTPITIPFFVLVFASILSLLKARYMFFSFVGFSHLIKGFLFYFYAVNNIRNKREMSVVLIALGLGVICQFLVASLEVCVGEPLGLAYFGGLDAKFRSMVGAEIVWRISGLMGHPNVLAKYLDFMLPLTLALSFVKGNAFLRRLATAAFFAGIICMGLTISRGGIVSAGIAVLSTLCFILIKSIKNGKFAVKAVVIGLLLISLCGAFSGKVIKRFVSWDGGSANTRLLQLNVAKNIAIAEPLTGIGIYNFAKGGRFYDDSNRQITRYFPAPVHNAYALMFVETGIIGFLAYMGMVGAILVVGFGNLRKANGDLLYINLGITLGFVAYFINGLVDTPLYSNITFVYFLAGLLTATGYLINGRTVSGEQERTYS